MQFDGNSRPDLTNYSSVPTILPGPMAMTGPGTTKPTSRKKPFSA
jgi:hypothetical protein